MIETTIIGKKKKNYYIFFKTVQFVLFSFPLLFPLSCSLSRQVGTIETSINRTEPLIIDHTCVNISRIPEYWIKKAKADFGISYGHTSHGSQIVSGMRVLMDQSGLYSFDRYGSRKSLALHDMSHEVTSGIRTGLPGH